MVKNTKSRQLYGMEKTIKEPVYKTVTKTAELGSKYYSGPIHLVMQEFGMPVYYG
jgi:hypothetical protein